MVLSIIIYTVYTGVPPASAAAGKVSALDKANGRVMVQRKKVAVLRREADDTAAIAIAHEGMEVDPEANPGMLLTVEDASICVLST